VYADGSGRPPLPTRLMTGLAILKHTYNKWCHLDRTARSGPGQVGSNGSKVESGLQRSDMQSNAG
jgi:hypothetical protein